MRFLIIGESQPWSAETSYARQLRRCGCEVEIWNNKKPRAMFGCRSWWELGRTSRALYDSFASIAFLKEATVRQPDVIFMPKAENIHSRAVKAAMRRTGAKLVTWYPDHPFKADMTSMSILRNLPRYDIFYIWGRFLVESIRAAGARRVEYLPFAFDPESHPTDVALTPDDRKRFASEVCFVGAWDRERERDLESLCSFDLAVWGPGWRENISASSPLRPKIRGGALYNEDLVKVYRCSAIVFNHLRLHNGSAHNVRSMEIAGIHGGVQLVRRTKELSEDLFTENEHLLCFEGNDELLNKVRVALSDHGLAKRLSDAAHQRVEKHHLLSERISRMVKDLRDATTRKHL